MKAEDNVSGKLGLGRFVLPIILWAEIVSVLNSPLFDALVSGRFSAPTAYILSIGLSLVPVGVLGLLFIAWLARCERVRKTRASLRSRSWMFKGSGSLLVCLFWCRVSIWSSYGTSRLSPRGDCSNLGTWRVLRLA